ncbi:MAG TPA: hypothetical protein VK595_00630 [Vicinamibacterales bacterium]|nr:hypothetical protein [Vicinamibacterales bacterium]
MATVKLWPGGLSGGHAPDASTARPGKRGKVNGWSASAARRNLAFLWSVNPDEMFGDGWAVTLTVAEAPDTADEWTAARATWLQACRDAGVTRYHWVTEWTKRGVPHTHAAVYGENPAMVGALLLAWLRIADARGWVVNTRGQHIVPIGGLSGWLQYVSKHASRGVRHYQHEGAPEGWEKTGRLWGYGGDWPIEEPEVLELSSHQYVVFRRLVWDWMLADMERREVDAEFVTSTRARWADPEHGNAHGVAGWIPGDVAYALYRAAKDAAPADHPWET